MSIKTQKAELQSGVTANNTKSKLKSKPVNPPDQPKQGSHPDDWYSCYSPDGRTLDELLELYAPSVFAFCRSHSAFKGDK